MPAYREDLISVLSQLSSIEINGTFNSANESCGLDSVEFDAPVVESSPRLAISWQTNATMIVLEWPGEVVGYQLEASPEIGRTNWTVVAGSVLTDGVFRAVVGQSEGTRFFRLRKQ